MEFNDGAKDIKEEVQQETTVRNFYFICSGLPGNTCSNPPSASDIFIYIDAKGLIHGYRRELLVPKGVDPSSIWIYKPNYWSEADFSGAFLNPSSEWTTGEGNGNVPMDWANSSMITKPAFIDVKEGLEQDQIYVRRGTGDFFFIATWCQDNYWKDTPQESCQQLRLH